MKSPQEQSQPPVPLPPMSPQTERRFPIVWVAVSIVVLLLVCGTALGYTYREKLFSLLPTSDDSSLATTATTTSPCYITQEGKVFRITDGDKVSPDSSYIVLGADSNTFTSLTKEPLSVFGVGGAQVSSSICYGKDAKHIFFGRYVITGADLDSFQILTANPRFAKDKNGLYRDGMRLFINIDVPSFSILDRIYGKDKNTVYSIQQSDCCEFFNPIPDADPVTFTSLGDYYARDKKSVYIFGRVLESADLATFTPLGCYYAKDANAVYRYDSVVKNANPATFTIPTDQPCDPDSARRDTFQNAFDISKQDPYIKNSTGVYWDSAPAVRNVEALGIPGPTPDYPKIEGADSATFVTLRNDPPFGKDKAHVYSGAWTVQGADPATFQVLSRYYAKDKNSVYAIWPQVKPLSGIDSKTFVVLDKDPFGYTNYVANGGLAKDNKNVYLDGQIIQDADASTFEVINTHFNKDAAHVYVGTTTISNDPEHFWGNPDGDFAVDSNTIYYNGKPIANVDLATFAVQRTYPYYYGIDAQHVYYVGWKDVVLMPEADPASFIVIDDSNNKIKYEAQDKNHFYYDSKIVQ